MADNEQASQQLEDEIEDVRFDVTHLQGSRNPSDPLSRRGFSDGNDPAASTGDSNAGSDQELFSRLGRNAPAPARLAVVIPKLPRSTQILLP